MSYKLEQLLEFNNYRELCGYFLSLTNDESTISKLKDILYNGKCGDFSFNTGITRPNNIDMEISRRFSMAFLLVNNPDTFEVIVNNNIKLFHGTKAESLPNILKYGLNSHAQLRAMGIEPTTGERSTRMKNSRDFVSLTDIFDVARDYASLSSSVEGNDLSFEVVIGTTQEEVVKNDIFHVSSDVNEVGVKKINTDSIKAIFVPSDKVKLVKKIIGDRNILVCSMDNYDKIFYYVDGHIEIIEENYQKLKNNTPSKRKVFSLSEIKDIAKDKLEKLKLMLNGRVEYDEHVGRNR